MDNREIGRMIDEEIKGQKPADGSKPLPDNFGEVTRSERLALQHGKKWDEIPKRLEVQDVNVGDFNNRLRDARAARDGKAPEERTQLTAEENAFIEAAIRSTVDSNGKIKTLLLAQGMATTDFSMSKHPYDEALRGLLSHLMRPDGVIARQFPGVIDSAANVATVRALLEKNVETNAVRFLESEAKKRAPALPPEGPRIELDTRGEDDGAARHRANEARKNATLRRDDLAMRDFTRVDQTRPKVAPKANAPEKKKEWWQFWKDGNAA